MICLGVAPFVGAWIEIQEWTCYIIIHTSLRSSERGLKFVSLVLISLMMLPSLRSSERGLKFGKYNSYDDALLSLRSSERGLKSFKDNTKLQNIIVAPFVGAWIEMSASALTCACAWVAPFVGAWIEMICTDTRDYLQK